MGQIGTHASPQFLFQKLAYDPLKDFEPITLLSISGIALAVHTSVPVASVKEFIAYAKAKPGGVNYGSAGVGTSSQLSGELFKQMTGANLVHVPYKGAGFALSALIAGEVQSAFLSTTTVASQMRSGRIKPLAVLSSKGFSAAPEIPSIAEQGFRGIEADVWFGLFAPAKTPRAIEFNTNPECRVFVGSPKSGGQDLNLLGFDPYKPQDYKTNCDWAIFYSYNWSWPERKQAEARAYRKGTRAHMRYTTLVVPGSIDDMIVERVRAKEEMSFSLQDIKSILAKALNPVVNGD